MKTTDILAKDSIAINIRVNDKKELLETMVQMASRSGNIIRLDDATREIFERERIMSTGIGKGIAIPHAKTNAVKETIAALATLDEPIDFDSIDDKPVDLVFLLLGRENNVGMHLRLLSKISRYLNNESFKSQIYEANSPEDVINVFKNIEENDIQ